MKTWKMVVVCVGLLAGNGTAGANSSDAYNSDSVAPSACHVISGTATFTARGYISNESTSTSLIVDCPIGYVVEDYVGEVEFQAAVRGNGSTIGSPTLLCTFSLENNGDETSTSSTSATFAVGKTYFSATLETFGYWTLSPARARCVIPKKNGNGAAYIAGFQTYGTP